MKTTFLSVVGTFIYLFICQEKAGPSLKLKTYSRKHKNEYKKRNKTNKVQNQCVAKKQNNLKAFSENFKVSNTIFKIRKQEELIKF